MPDNGGRRRGLVCPNNAKTHFHRFLRLATLSAYGVALCGYPKKDGYSFLARIFSFYYCSTQFAKKQAFCNVPLQQDDLAASLSIFPKILMQQAIWQALLFNKTTARLHKTVVLFQGRYVCAVLYFKNKFATLYSFNASSTIARL